jgi:hypothetical protein
MKVLLLNARAAFPQYWDAKKIGDTDKPAFSGAFLFEDRDPVVKYFRDDVWKDGRLRQVIDLVGKEKWADKWLIAPKSPKTTFTDPVSGQKLDVTSVKSLLIQNDLLPIHDGNTKANFAGYAGNWFVNARSYVRPTVHDRNKNPLTEADGKPYAGCYVNAVVDVWAQDHAKHGKRINASLGGVQFVRDGDAFSGGSVADAEDFPDLGDQGDDSDLAA